MRAEGEGAKKSVSHGWNTDGGWRLEAGGFAALRLGVELRLDSVRELGRWA